MQFKAIILLTVTALVFVLWAITLFRTLLAIRRRAAARTGKTLPGPVDTLVEWRHWAGDPACRKDRNRLIGLTLSVLLLNLAMSIALG